MRRLFLAIFVTGTCFAAAAGCSPGRVGSGDAGSGERDSGTSGERDSGSTRPDSGAPACTGCLDVETGGCLRGESEVACGTGGAPCDVCSPTERCEDSVCVAQTTCSPDNCDGCCDGTACVTSDSIEACGSGGAACETCTAPEECIDGMCVAPSSCGPESCSGCCDDTETCQDGTSMTACGAGGALCEMCPAGWTCESGVCTAPCADTCEGCCTADGTCLDGSSDAAACGRNGETCMDCGTGGSCSTGYCVSSSCSASCDGCCSGDACLGGSSSTACGSDGNACVDCGGSFTCSSAGDCEVDPVSRWNLYVVRSSFSVFNPNGDLWDPGSSGRPDPFVTVVASSSVTSSNHEGRSSTIDDTIMPEWGEGSGELLLMEVPAGDLREGTTLDIIDDDTFSDDHIGRCFWTPSHNAFQWGTVRLTCPARSADPETIEVELVVRLERF